jgi:hypothetical protein
MLSPCLLALVRFSFTHKETIQFTYLLTNSIHYEKESIFFDDDAFACLRWRSESRGGYHWRRNEHDLRDSFQQPLGLLVR